MQFYQALYLASLSNKIIEIQEKEEGFITLTAPETITLFNLLSKDKAKEEVGYKEGVTRIIIKLYNSSNYRVKELIASGELVDISPKFILQHGLIDELRIEEYCQKFHLNYLHRENLTIIYSDKNFRHNDYRKRS